MTDRRDAFFCAALAGLLAGDRFTKTTHTECIRAAWYIAAEASALDPAVVRVKELKQQFFNVDQVE